MEYACGPNSRFFVQEGCLLDAGWVSLSAGGRFLFNSDVRALLSNSPDVGLVRPAVQVCIVSDCDVCDLEPGNASSGVLGGRLIPKEHEPNEGEPHSKTYAIFVGAEAAGPFAVAR